MSDRKVWGDSCEFSELIGKKITSIERKKFPGEEEYDDEGCVFIITEDGCEYSIEGSYCGYTGKSGDEYPEWISIRKKIK